MNLPELLAPAGSLPAVYAAAQAGADAIYLGVGSFNARANALNFSREDLEGAIRYCYPRNVRVYLAMNTLLHDDEETEALEWVRYAVERGIHAIIVQDIGLMARIRECFPGLPIHASTQMNMFASDSVIHAAKAGIKRIILPRELTIDQIRSRARIARQEGIELEVFIHGALCVSCSGLCLFSAMNGSGARSGNRGLCAQPCREGYELLDRDGALLRKGRIFSIKDQSALLWLKEMMQFGISSFKIEGRMKAPDYVRTSVRFYREWIDRISAGETVSPEESAAMKDSLLISFNRGGTFTSGHMSGNRFDLPAGNFSGKFGILIGHIETLIPRNGSMDISINRTIPIKTKDIVSIRKNDHEEASFPIGRVSFQNGRCTIWGLHPDTMEKLESGMSVYLTKINDITDFFDRPEKPRKSPVVFRIEGVPEDEVNISVSARIEDLFGEEITVRQTFMLPADYNGPILEKQRIEEQLSRCGDSPFWSERVEFSGGFSVRAPISYINRIRRTLLAVLEERIESIRISKPGRISRDLNAEKTTCSLPNQKISARRILSSPVALEYLSLRVNRAEIFRGIRYYIFSVYDIADMNSLMRIESLVKEQPDTVVLVRLPGFCSDPQSDWVKEKIASFSQKIGPSFKAVLTSDRFFSGAPVILSHQANLFNADALCEALKSGSTAFSLSEELTDENMIRIMSDDKIRDKDLQLIIRRHGPVEWMQSAFCPLGQNRENCCACEDRPVAFLRSASNPHKGKSQDMPFVLFHPEFCTTELFGPGRHTRSDETLRLLKTMNIDMMHLVRVFTESPEQIGDIIATVCDGSCDMK